MPQILDRFDVNKTLVDIIEYAKHEILLISPYIKLNQHLKISLRKHADKKDFRLIIVYGKNDEDNRMSLSENDLTFFKTFQNVEVRYHHRLHAKLYANDFDCLITSMNLHTYSMNENIEVGILIKMNLMRDFACMLTSSISNSLESQTRNFAEYVIRKSQLHFSQHVNKEKHLFGLITTYGEKVIDKNKKRTGFCIRTGGDIPYNPQHPYSGEAYHSWAKWKNENYKERYCHGCGKETITSMAKPLCIDCLFEKQ